MKESNARLQRKIIELVKALEAQRGKGTDQRAVGVYQQMIAERDHRISEMEKKYAHLERVKPKNAPPSRTLDEFKHNVEELQRENNELRKQVSAHSKITHLQGKALDKITHENEYPLRMDALIEALRVEKMKNQKLREANRNFDKSSKMQIERLVNMEQQIRSLQKTKEVKVVNEDPAEQVEMMGQLNRATTLLQKSKATDQKILKMHKKVFEKAMIDM